MEAEAAKLITALLTELEQGRLHLSQAEWQTLYQGVTQAEAYSSDYENQGPLLNQLIETLRAIPPIAHRFGRYLLDLQARLVRQPTGIKRRPAAPPKLRPLLNKLVTLSEQKQKNRTSTDEPPRQ